MTQSQNAKIRVLVVDDSAFIRRAIIRMFEQSPAIQIIDVASDGAMAVDLVKKLRPDVVTLDIQMPVLDGLRALERIMTECPTPVIMLSSLTGKGGDNTLKALELGAVDFIDKSAAGGPMDIAALNRELTGKILIASRVDLKKLQSETCREEKFPAEAPVTRKADTEVILIGTSTGGPPALQAILARIPASFPCPILIVQHMPVGFTSSLAERLNRLSPVAVKEAQEGDLLRPGQAYIAPAGTHMRVRRRGKGLQVCLDLQPENVLHRPSVDILFQSAAAACGSRCLAFVLTGMGKDGAVGAKAVKDCGGRVVVEGEETAIVFGMPKAVMATVTVDAVVPLHQVADTMMTLA